MGNLKWWNNYIPTSPVKDTIAQCYLYDVLEMPDKGFAAVGWAGPSWSPFNNIQQTWLLRVDSMGCLVPGCSPPAAINEYTKDMISITRNADILISGVGKKGLIKGDMVKKGALVIDAGTSVEDGRSAGDVNFESVAKKAGFLTPVPGGVGPLTVVCLFQNLAALKSVWN
jgi:hypothetical protein